MSLELAGIRMICPLVGAKDDAYRLPTETPEKRRYTAWLTQTKPTFRPSNLAAGSSKIIKGEQGRSRRSWVCKRTANAAHSAPGRAVCLDDLVGLIRAGDPAFAVCMDDVRVPPQPRAKCLLRDLKDLSHVERSHFARPSGEDLERRVVRPTGSTSFESGSVRP